MAPESRSVKPRLPRSGVLHMHADKAFVALFAALCMAPARAAAQQALDDFIASSDQHGIDVRTAQAALDTARSQADEARARLLPWRRRHRGGG